MFNQSNRLWSASRLKQQVARIAALLQQIGSGRLEVYTPLVEAHWLELIVAVGDLVEQSARQKRPVCFLTTSCCGEPRRDITDLLECMRSQAYQVNEAAGEAGGLQILNPLFNHVYGVGYGRFSNGVSFACPHQHELVFFIGLHSIGFHQDLVRAFVNAKHQLQLT